MAIFVGTNGNDSIIGTSDDDTVNPLRGRDIVNAGAGIDTLIVDYSLSNTPLVYSQIFDSGSSYYGWLGSTSGADRVDFDGVERIDFRASRFNDSLNVSLQEATPSGSFSLYGGAGFDTINVFATMANTTFVVDAAGNFDAYGATLTGWENVGLTVGDGVRNVRLGSGNDWVDGNYGTGIISTGAGQDIIYVDADLIDGGSGRDLWYFGDTSASNDFDFNLDGANGYLINESSGRRIDIVGIEDIRLTFGIGNDTVTTNADSRGNALYIGSGGLNTFSANRTGILSDDSVLIGGFGLNNYSGTIISSETVTQFEQFSNVDIKLSDGNDRVDVSLNVGVDAPMVIDGGSGNNSVRVQLIGGNVLFSVDPTDVATFLGVKLLNFDTFVVSSEQGNDSILTGSGDDQINGNGGNDILKGAGGNDVIRGGAGDDMIDGGDGLDTASFIDAASGVRVNLSLVAPQSTGDGRDTLISIENLTGSFHNDGLRGNALANVLDGEHGNDNLIGFGGNDTLIGNFGNDTLLGGDGNDVLRGGAGRDLLTGGAGEDVFAFDYFSGTREVDSIRDFSSAQDKIALSKSVFTAFAGDALGTFAASSFFVGPKALTADQHIIYNAATGALFYDVDGVGGVAQVQIATLAAHPALAVSDLLLIG